MCAAFRTRRCEGVGTDYVYMVTQHVTLKRKRCVSPVRIFDRLTSCRDALRRRLLPHPSRKHACVSPLTK